MTTKAMHQLAQEISEKKRFLSGLVAAPVEEIARACLEQLSEPEKLDSFLQQAIQDLPYCTMLYVLDSQYCQLSANIGRDTIEFERRGQNRSQRPYLQATIPHKGLVLSNPYQDSYSSKSCITLVQAIQLHDELLGFMVADFNLDELPVPNDISRMMSNWQQFKGDPAIRGALFNQQRTSSHLDIHINNVHKAMQVLMIKNGVFHFKLHYSSSRVTLWLYDQPHHYRLHSIDDLLSDSVFASYPERHYPNDACVDVQQLDIVLKQFKALRFIDENIYLRSASVNIINGMVGLNFSCDGSHYIPVQEFIENNMNYWLGT